jgi:ribonuclease E
VPFLRFSRDKRGYEHTYLVHAATKRGKAARPRVLYWYRTPPGIRIGRQPFDDGVRKALEEQNPGIVFDWPVLVATPFPPAEPEHWREKRRVERLARQSRREDEEDETPDAPSSETEDGPLTAVAPIEVQESTVATDGSQTGEGDAVEQAAAPARKRRRRGGRRRPKPDGQSPETSTDSETAVDAPSESSVSSSEEQE